MNHPYKTIISVMLLIVSIATGLSLVYATDNTDPSHWHSQNPDYKILSSIPSHWRGPIHKAAEAWSNKTSVLISLDSSSGNTIWRGRIPIGVTHLGMKF